MNFKAEKWRDELLPLGSRIKVRFNTEYAPVEQLHACLSHMLERAGNVSLMSAELMQMLCIVPTSLRDIACARV